MTSSRPRARPTEHENFVSSVDAIELSEDELASEEKAPTRRSRQKQQREQTQYNEQAESDDDDDSVEETGTGYSKLRRSAKNAAPSRKSLRNSKPNRLDDSDMDVIAASESDSDDYGADVLRSDVQATNKRKRSSRGGAKDPRRTKAVVRTSTMSA
jgi:hypothetical protein